CLQDEKDRSAEKTADQPSILLFLPLNSIIESRKLSPNFGDEFGYGVRSRHSLRTQHFGPSSSSVHCKMDAHAVVSEQNCLLRPTAPTAISQEIAISQELN